jgi:N-formylglutamate deformylase
MSFPVRSLAGSTPLVLDSPHSGVDYPDDFGHACNPQALRQAEDTHVEKLYDFAPAMGTAWIEALFPRSYIDVNRNTTEIDVALLDGAWPDPVETDPKALAKVRLGKGLVWRMTDDGMPIYERRLSVQEVHSRIERCWRPYHDEVRAAIAAACARHGYCIHLNCHSMPAIASAYSSDFPGLAHADFVIGDRDGTTAAPELSRMIRVYVESLGYSVAYNHPYKGVELVRRYGDPQRDRHSIQIEINRKLYMDERTLELHEGFEPLKRHLRSLVEMLLRTDPRKLA